MKKTLYERKKGVSKNISYSMTLSQNAQTFITRATIADMIIIFVGMILTFKNMKLIVPLVLYTIISVIMIIFIGIRISVSEKGKEETKKEWEDSRIVTTEHIDYKHSVFSDSYDHTTVEIKKEKKEVI